MYKILSGDKIVDVVDVPQYVRYQNRHGKFLACDKLFAQGIVSHNGKTIWQLKDAASIPIDGFDTVELIKIAEDEYETLKEIFDKADEEADSSTANLTPVEKATLEFVVETKIKEMSKACNDIILNGFDIELSDGKTYHFALSIEDQVNMLKLKELYNDGVKKIPYHSSGELCKYYDAEDIAAILEYSDEFKNYNIVYFDSLRNYIKALNDISKVKEVFYGMEIPKKYQSEVFIKEIKNKTQER